MSNYKTPPSGIPSAKTLLTATRPGDTTPPPRSSPSFVESAADATFAILASIEQLRGEIHPRIDKLEKRLEDVDRRQTAQHLEQTKSLAAVAQAAATAANLALEAKQKAVETEASVQLMVESALKIHSKGLAVMVDASVQRALKPIANQVVNTNEALGAIVDELGIEGQVQLGRDVKPGEKPPEPALQKMEKRAKHNQLVQAVIATGVIVEALVRIFHPHL